MQSSLVEFIVIQDIQVLAVEFRVPTGISTIVWVIICRIIVINEGNGHESGGNVCGVIRIPNRKYLLEEMGVVVGYDRCFFASVTTRQHGDMPSIVADFLTYYSWRIS